MALGNQRNQSISNNQSINNPGNGAAGSVKVYHVILSEDDDILKDFGIPVEFYSKYIGAIQYKLPGTTKSDASVSIALPLNQNYTTLPTKNELVAIIKNASGGVFYERIGKSPTPNINATEDNIKTSVSPNNKTSNDTSSTYSNVNKTGITRSNKSDTDDMVGYGSYFTSTEGVHPLRLYEGDTVIESRFGQSIRFSGYNNPENEYNPTVTIRNIENADSTSNDLGKSTVEDINKDGNIIFLGSGEHLLPYTLPVLNTHPSFINYPSELTGNQIVINSDRVLLSAKAAEMIFVSKKDMGFITDGQLSIDATDGINVTVEGNTILNTNGRDVNINTQNGKINLGDTQLESLVKGETLVNLMTELITAIEAMTHLTPSGPSTPPVNAAAFTTVKSKLKTMLSNLNKTS